LEAEAFELIGRTHCPTESEKQQVHDLVEDFATRPLPPEFRLRPHELDGDDDYEMFANKFFRKTWDVLQDASMAFPVPTRATHFFASHPTGLALMSLLADCCAGATFARVTDRGDAYSSLAGLLVDRSNVTGVNPCGASRTLDGVISDMAYADEPSVLVSLALEVVDLDCLTLKQLIRLRKSERKTTGSSLRDLRHRLSERVASQAVALCSVARSRRDQDELRRQFQEDMRDDYAALKESLKLEAKQVLGTKEIVAAVLATAGIAATLNPRSFSELAAVGGASPLVVSMPQRPNSPPRVAKS